MRRFELHRDEDMSGVSGTGVVAEGVEFSDGTVALRWSSRWPTSVVFHDRGMRAVEAVHGHGGATRVVWLDSLVAEMIRDATREVEPAPMTDVVYPAGRHDYWSTHCRHNRHDACAKPELAPGVPRRPAQCTTCAAPCRCTCHA